MHFALQTPLAIPETRVLRPSLPLTTSLVNRARRYLNCKIPVTLHFTISYIVAAILHLCSCSFSHWHRASNRDEID